MHAHRGNIGGGETGHYRWDVGDNPLRQSSLVWTDRLTLFDQKTFALRSDAASSADSRKAWGGRHYTGESASVRRAASGLETRQGWKGEEANARQSLHRSS